MKARVLGAIMAASVCVGYEEPAEDSGSIPTLAISRDLGRTWATYGLGSVVMPPLPGTSYAEDGRGIAYFAHVQSNGTVDDVVVTAVSPEGPLGELSLETLPSYDSFGHYWGVAGLDDGAYVLWNSPSDKQGPASWYFKPSGQDFDLKGARVYWDAG